MLPELALLSALELELPESEVLPELLALLSALELLLELLLQELLP